MIVAAAGKAAHLAGFIAAHTVLPVIGLPVKSSTLDGLDSLLSVVQMPNGVPRGNRGDKRRAERGYSGGADACVVRRGSCKTACRPQGKDALGRA